MRLPRHITPYGRAGFLLSWQAILCPAINRSVHAFAGKVTSWPEVTEAVPAYASLLVLGDPHHPDFSGLRERLYDLRPVDSGPVVGQLHQLPVRYDGPDLAEVATTLGLPPDDIIRLHTGPEYLVYQLGYQPGFGFLGPTDARLVIRRRATPRPRVPAGAVGLAGHQTGVYPTAGPGGWQLIGRCPLPMLRADDDFSRLRAGDRVRFRAITAEAFDHLTQSPPPWPQR